MKSDKFDITDAGDGITTILHIDTECQLIALDQQDIDENGEPIEGQFSTVVLSNDQYLTIMGILWDRTDANWYLNPEEEIHSVH